MIEITCFYFSDRGIPVNFTFVKYEKFMKIYLNYKSIIMSIENFEKSEILNLVYSLALKCTENSKEISSIVGENNEFIYGVFTKSIRFQYQISNKYDFIILKKRFLKNPLLSQEPKRETSIKKQNKFLRMLFYEYGRITDYNRT